MVTDYLSMVPGYLGRVLWDKDLGPLNWAWAGVPGCPILYAQYRIGIENLDLPSISIVSVSEKVVSKVSDLGYVMAHY